MNAANARVACLHASAPLMAVLVVALWACGCQQISWPVDRPDHRAHQGYGNFQEEAGSDNMHNGLDAVGSGDGPQVAPYAPYDIADVLAAMDNWILYDCVSYTPAPHHPGPGVPAGSYFRELQPAFRNGANDRYATYGHVHEHDWADPDYIVLLRHQLTAAPLQRACVSAGVDTVLQTPTGPGDTVSG